MGVLMAQLGAVRAGNVMSPNPNDIAAAEGFVVPLTSIIAVGIIPAVTALIVTSLLAYLCACAAPRSSGQRRQARSTA